MKLFRQNYERMKLFVWGYETALLKTAAKCQ